MADLDDDEKGVTTSDTLGGQQTLNIISLPGVFSLTFKSRKPEARRFTRWVTHEVLPQIMKTGRYEVNDNHADDIKGVAITDPLYSEPLPFDRRQALAEVKEARLIFGSPAARSLWKQSPHLPRVPEMEGPVAGVMQDEGPDCLSFLLESVVDSDMRTVRDLIHAAENGENGGGAALERIGLKLGADGVWLDPAKPEMKSLWRKTRWRDGLWISHLRRLPGVTGNHPRMSIGGHQCRPIWVPAILL